jgi:hypothetical protein
LWTTSQPDAKWLEFDFGDAYEISRYVIRHAGASGMSRNFNTRGFTVQTSLDRESWKSVDVFKKNTENVTDVDVDSVTARFLKITVDHPGDDSTARIGDIEIFGKKRQ